MANNDVRRLVRRLREAGANELQSRMAGTILACNGLESALQYVNGLPNSHVPLEAAEAEYFEAIADGTF
jgi:hypothetical protein